MRAVPASPHTEGGPLTSLSPGQLGGQGAMKPAPHCLCLVPPGLTLPHRTPSLLNPAEARMARAQLLLEPGKDQGLVKYLAGAPNLGALAELDWDMASGHAICPEFGRCLRKLAFFTRCVQLLRLFDV